LLSHVQDDLCVHVAGCHPCCAGYVRSCAMAAIGGRALQLSTPSGVREYPRRRPSEVERLHRGVLSAQARRYRSWNVPVLDTSALSER
jgi:hypothetical protein